MSVHEPTPFRAATPSVDADRAMKFGVGVAAAPLWATFFTAAGAGMAYWWMTAWARQEQSPSFAFADFEPAPEDLIPLIEPAPAAPEPAAPTAHVHIEPTVDMLRSEPPAAVEEVVEEVIEIVVATPAAVTPSEPKPAATVAAEARSEPKPAAAVAAEARSEPKAAATVVAEQPSEPKPAAAVAAKALSEPKPVAKAAPTPARTEALAHHTPAKPKAGQKKPH